jgi:hypothetical protein
MVLKLPYLCDSNRIVESRVMHAIIWIFWMQSDDPKTVLALPRSSLEADRSEFQLVFSVLLLSQWVSVHFATKDATIPCSTECVGGEWSSLFLRIQITSGSTAREQALSIFRELDIGLWRLLTSEISQGWKRSTGHNAIRTKIFKVFNILENRTSSSLV